MHVYFYKHTQGIRLSLKVTCDVKADRGIGGPKFCLRIPGFRIESGGYRDGQKSGQSMLCVCVFVLCVNPHLQKSAAVHANACKHSGRSDDR